MPCTCQNSNEPGIVGGTCGGGDCGSKSGVECSSNSQCESGGGTGGWCFVKETKITMSDNTLKNIEDVKIGDEVISWNEETKKLSTAKVIKLKRPIHKNMVTIEWEHGVTTNTFDHPFYSVTKNEWISYKPELTSDRYDFDDVQQLEVGNPTNPIGDIGLSLDKNNKLVESKILSVKENIEETQTYIFELDKDNTFFANGILTHNKGNGGGGGESGGGMAAPAKPERFINDGMYHNNPYVRNRRKNMQRGFNPYRRGGQITGGRSKCQRGYGMLDGVCQPMYHEQEWWGGWVAPGAPKDSDMGMPNAIGNTIPHGDGHIVYPALGGCPGVSCPCDGGWTADCDCSGGGTSCPQCKCVMEVGKLVYRQGGMTSRRSQTRRPGRARSGKYILPPGARIMGGGGPGRIRIHSNHGALGMGIECNDGWSSDCDTQFEDSGGTMYSCPECPGGGKAHYY